MRFEQPSGFTHAGHLTNEDSFLIGKSYVAVIDGATGLEGIHHTDANSDAAWLSVRLCELLREPLEDVTRSIEEILSDCASRLKQELISMGYEDHAAEYLFPSACVSILRVQPEALEYYLLGDAPIVLMDAAEKTSLYRDSTVPLRDQSVIQSVLENAHKNGTSFITELPKAKDNLRFNRTQMNQSEGYAIFNPYGTGINKAVHGTIPVSELALPLSFSLFSDGFEELISLYHTYTPAELQSLLEKGEALQVYEKLKALALAEDSMNQYPRLKDLDDATAVWGRIV